MISKRAAAIAPSSTILINKKVLELRSRGRKIISFGIGEPDFNVPDEAKEAVIRAVRADASRYTPSDGLPELKQAIIKKLRRENNLEYKENEVMASSGAKQCLFQAFTALLDQGDEVVLPAPYWVSYPEQIKLAGGMPVIAKTDEKFVLHAETLFRRISPRTKIIILNSPSNPTGAVIPEEELRLIAELAAQKNIFIISDEVYEYFVYDREHVSPASLSEEIKKRTIVINGVSKSFGMTGWRLGYAAGPAKIISAMKNIQDQVTSNPSSLTQQAAIAALALDKQWFSKILADFKDKRDYLCDSLRQMGLAVVAPQGAFYIFFDVSRFYHAPIHSSDDFCADLLEKTGVALTPGSGFGDDRRVRLSYAADWQNLKNGLEKIKTYLMLPRR